MRSHQTIVALRDDLHRARSAGRSIGLVPTMGYLHAGHASLIRAAATECDEVVVTVFVNPLQFAAGEDLDAYPRDLDADVARSTEAGATVMFAPDRSEMYPRPVMTNVSVRELSTTMEGASRPTHFDGVATVVAKLLSIVGACRAYFGEKDFQQLAIIRRMVEDLSMPVGVVGCPIVRDADGLALSSRNVYLTPEERSAAPVLRRALLAGAAAIAAGERSADEIRRLMSATIVAEPLAALDYVEVADTGSLARLDVATAEARLLVAARFGRARLIDNLAADPAASESAS